MNCIGNGQKYWIMHVHDLVMEWQRSRCELKGEFRADATDDSAISTELLALEELAERINDIDRNYVK